MKAVVADLDGTLLKEDRSLSLRTISIFNELKFRGIPVIIATARPPRSVFTILPPELACRYIVCYNGAEIYEGGTKIFHENIGAEKAESIVKWLVKKYPENNISIEINNYLYTNFNMSVTKIKGWVPPYEQVDFNTFRFRPAAKIIVDLASAKERAGLENILFPDCSVIFTDNGGLGQIAHINVSKISSIRKLAAVIGCQLKDIVAFGDDYNDIDMIRECGIGVAMVNAPDDVKAAADIIAATNEEDGVAAELEKMLKMLN